MGLVAVALEHESGEEDFVKLEDASEGEVVEETDSAFEQVVEQLDVVHPAVEDACEHAAEVYQVASVGIAEVEDKTGYLLQHVLMDVGAGDEVATGPEAENAVGDEAAYVDDDVVEDGEESRLASEIGVAVDGDEAEDGVVGAALEDEAGGVAFGNAVVAAHDAESELVAEDEHDPLVAVDELEHEFAVAFEGGVAQAHLEASVGLVPGFEVVAASETGDGGGIGIGAEVAFVAEAGAGTGAGPAQAPTSEAVAALGSEIGDDVEAACRAEVEAALI